MTSRLREYSSSDCWVRVVRLELIRLDRSNKRRRRTIGLIHEVHIARVAPRRVDRKDNERTFHDFGNTVHYVAPEEEQLSWPEFDGLAPIHEERSPPANHLQILIACLVKMGGHRPVDAKQPGTSRGLIGQPHVEQHRIRGGRKSLRESQEIKCRRRHSRPGFLGFHYGFLATRVDPLP